jgi:trehalose 6-phosphate phosphatase
MKHALSELADFDRRIAAGRILLATDFDGTLCPLAEHPDNIHLSPAMLEILRGLAGTSRVLLAVISGRSLADVTARLRLDCVMAGNHGLEITGKGLQFRHAVADSLKASLRLCCQDLANEVSAFPGAWVEDKGLSATVHYRHVDSRRQRQLLVGVRRVVSNYAAALAMRSGKCALELRPKVDWDKGAAVRFINDHLGGSPTTICTGDDRTDETMFRANAGGLNVRIGATGPTAAQYYVSGPSEVAVLLSHILDVCGSAEVDRRSATSG